MRTITPSAALASGASREFGAGQPQIDHIGRNNSNKDFDEVRPT
jgi:hypothetical protein